MCKVFSNKMQIRQIGFLNKIFINVVYKSLMFWKLYLYIWNANFKEELDGGNPVKTLN